MNTSNIVAQGRQGPTPGLVSVLLVLALLGFPFQATALIDDVDSYIEAEMKRQALPGVSIAVVQNNKLVKARGYGLANVELNVPASAETIYQSGSLGKQFTATAVMMLVEEGKLGLDEPIGKYLPTVPVHWRGITIRHLLTHTAGTASYPEDFDFRRDYSEDELLSRLTEAPLQFLPGQDWRYSNVGYVTLGVLLGKRTGKFYGEYLRERVFEPAGMTTARNISEEDIVQNRAAGYKLKQGELKNQDWVSPSLNTTADGSLYVSVLDLAKWDLALSTGKLIRPSSLEIMWTPARLNTGDTRPYGFGWQVREINGHRLVEHGGEWQGFSTHVARYRDDGLTVIVLTNLAKANAASIAHGIAGLYEAELTPVQQQAVSVDCEILDGYVGSYELTPAMVVRISSEGCQLWAQATGQARNELFAVSQTRFSAKSFDAQISFVTDSSGKVSKLVLHQDGDHEARRID